VGVRPADSLEDLALVSTVLEAARFQAVRRRFHTAPDLRLLISAADLRRYRRAPVPEHLLLLVLDYTSLEDCAWEHALLPFLRRAYAERAGLTLIQVGAGGPTNRVQANRLVAPSLLVPQVFAAFEAGPGEATPLAHGLDLALATLNQVRQSKKASLAPVQVVVLTDGRGNVPLAASRAGQPPPQRVTREGIEDALELARAFAALPGVEVTLLNPQPQHLPELPLELARALGATVFSIPPREKGG
jgi:magnesium chelatase subunit D